jgi:thymidylate synthase (FAD)
MDEGDRVVGHALHDAEKGEEVAVGLRYEQLAPRAGAIDPDDERRIDCLDHGFVRLVDHMGGDLSIVRAARVSYDAAWRAGEDQGSDTRLIHFLWSHAHTTPFEAVTLTFEVKAPIFVFRQWHRHRTWSYNELSARYRELPTEFYVPDPDKVGVQSVNNKQGRDPGLEEGLVAARTYQAQQIREHSEDAFGLYRHLLNEGWPRELARSVLPVNTYSHMFATVNLLNLFRFLTLRDDSHAQYEIQVYAHAMRALARSVAPIAVSAWEKGRANEENGRS